MVVDGVNQFGGVEEVADDDWGVEVVVHGLVAFLAVGFDVGGRGLGGLQLAEGVVGLHETLVAFLSGLEGFVAEVNGAAVVGLEDEEADGHGGVGLVEHLAALAVLVAATEELVEGDEVAEGLAHLLAVDGNHVIVHPVAAGAVAGDGGLLGNLAFVVGEHEVHSAAVDVEGLAEIFGAHGGALGVPAGETVAPGGRPAHDVFG